MRTVRPSPLAGKWYPSQADRLQRMISIFLDQVEPPSLPSDATVRGVLAPHAGIQYSGAAAAHAFHLWDNQPVDIVVVIGPLHRPITGVRAPLITSDHIAYSTPLGEVPVDHEVLQALGNHIPLTYCQRDIEHSIEIELPFLQTVLPQGWKLVPLMLVAQSELAALLGSALHDIFANEFASRRVLYVASSDLSHFYSRVTAQQLDHMMLAAVEAMRPQEVLRLNEQNVAFACGYGAIATVMYALQATAPTQAHILCQTDSGMETGDLSNVVGYGSAAFTQRGIHVR